MFRLVVLVAPSSEHYVLHCVRRFLRACYEDCVGQCAIIPTFVSRNYFRFDMCGAWWLTDVRSSTAGTTGITSSVHLYYRS